MITCRKCKEEVKLTYTKTTNKRMEKNRLCFDCQYWFELSKVAHQKQSVRINGEHYWIGLEEAGVSGRGYNGQKFTILFNSGRLVETTNLWHNGPIPKKWLRRLPNNAKFITTPWQRRQHEKAKAKSTTRKQRTSRRV